MTRDPHDLAAPYALDALTGVEQRRFERHLSGCAGCADEVAGLRETTTRLALAAARRPPDALRGRVLAEIARTRQSPPPLGRRLPPSRRGPGGPTGLAWLAAAACLVLALTGGGLAAHFHRQADRAQALNRQVTVVMAAPDARTSTVRVQDTATLTVVSSRTLNRAVVTTSRLWPLPPDKTYQLWWLGPAAPRSAGTLDASSTSRPVVAEGLGNARSLGVTVERSGGSHQPTNAPILTLDLT
ncbi:anti-sigma factor domain-containing protein [Actinomadura sp. 9N215]|uniref:anti-sigma factor n=1 Tax=Actinomadura sp. 9N215 TaxID=3375150 RepID=UPI0037A6F8C2